ncbi:MAG: hypothetical protein HIU84_00410 [Acidobacteria bacterium]|nr:hypothetical protein [Acidobacteriota bacterium]
MELLAARLGRAAEHDVVLIDPAHDHYCQAPWTLRDACDAPTSKTGAAMRRQSPVVVAFDE